MTLALAADASRGAASNAEELQVAGRSSRAGRGGVLAADHRADAGVAARRGADVGGR